MRPRFERDVDALGHELRIDAAIRAQALHGTRGEVGPADRTVGRDRHVVGALDQGAVDDGSDALEDLPGGGLEGDDLAAPDAGDEQPAVMVDGEAIRSVDRRPDEHLEVRSRGSAALAVGGAADASVAQASATATAASHRDWVHGPSAPRRRPTSIRAPPADSKAGGTLDDEAEPEPSGEGHRPGSRPASRKAATLGHGTSGSSMS
jgi:hypothetical protein